MSTKLQASGKLPAELRAEDVTAIIDTREQTPVDLSPLRTITGTLSTGDYSIRGLEDFVAVERKSLDDLLGCVGRERDRFEREIHRLMAFPHRLLVIESGWLAIERGEWRSQITPRQVRHSVLGWQAKGLPVHISYDHARAGADVAAFLYLVAKRRWRELRSFGAGVLG